MAFIIMFFLLLDVISAEGNFFFGGGASTLNLTFFSLEARKSIIIPEVQQFAAAVAEMVFEKRLTVFHFDLARRLHNSDVSHTVGLFDVEDLQVPLSGK